MLYPSDMPRNVELEKHKPLVEQEIFAALAKNGVTWNHLKVMAEVDSTNTYIQRNIGKIVSGNPYLVTADQQSVGIGRLDRTWFSPHGAGIALSIGVATEDIPHELSAIPLVVGLAVHEALQAFGIASSLKWPNDVVFIDSSGLRKAGGILVQCFQGFVIAGIGLNVGLQKHELPVDSATSLSLEGYEISREEIIAGIIQQIERTLCSDIQWHNEYVSACSSLGRIVRVTQLDSVCFSGIALRVDPDGALVLQTNTGEQRVTIGDVEHAVVN